MLYQLFIFTTSFSPPFMPHSTASFIQNSSAQATISSPLFTLCFFFWLALHSKQDLSSQTRDPTTPCSANLQVHSHSDTRNTERYNENQPRRGKSTFNKCYYLASTVKTMFIRGIRLWHILLSPGDCKDFWEKNHSFLNNGMFAFR